MSSSVQFCVVDDGNGSRSGKLKVPHRKVADWLNFLVSPRQDVQITSAENLRGSVMIYFQGSEALYTYLSSRLSQPTTKATKETHQPLEQQVAS